MRSDSKIKDPILVAGAAGRVGAVGRTVAELLRQRGLPVRALVHREDERAAGLRATGAEIVVADLTVPADVARAMEGCRRIYFGMSRVRSNIPPPHLSCPAISVPSAANRYDRITHDVETITGRPATSVREFVATHADRFAPNQQPRG